MPNVCVCLHIASAKFVLIRFYIPFPLTLVASGNPAVSKSESKKILMRKVYGFLTASWVKKFSILHCPMRPALIYGTSDQKNLYFCLNFKVNLLNDFIHYYSCL